jgi:hypothetical protein
MKRFVIASAAAIGLALGTAFPSSALGLQEATLACSDGTTTTVTADASTVLGLAQAVQAMIDYPAGLECSLSQAPVAAFGGVAMAAPGRSPFIVGGGRWRVPCATIVGGGGGGGGIGAPVPQVDDLVWVNIAVNAHEHDDGSFFGSLNETIPANQFCDGVPVGETHFTSKPTCLVIAAATPIPPVQPPAFVTSEVTQTSGQVPFPAGNGMGTVEVGDFVHFGFQDNGNPGQQATDDQLNGPPATPSRDGNRGCTAGSPPPAFDLLHGNISVHR